MTAARLTLIGAGGPLLRSRPRAQPVDERAGRPSQCRLDDLQMSAAFARGRSGDRGERGTVFEEGGPAEAAPGQGLRGLSGSEDPGETALGNWRICLLAARMRYFWRPLAL